MAEVITRATKQQARYTPAGGRERCGLCRFYNASGGCLRVIGPVSVQGWCKYFSREAVQQYQGATYGTSAAPNLNLLPNSEQFNLWTLFGGTLPTVTANTQSGPSGPANTADTLSLPAAGQSGIYYQTTIVGRGHVFGLHQDPLGATPTSASSIAMRGRGLGGHRIGHRGDRGMGALLGHVHRRWGCKLERGDLARCRHG